MSLEISAKLRRCGPLLLAGVLMTNMLPVGVLAANIKDFKDVDSHWAYNALDWAVETGVMAGTSEDTMSPDGLLTRAQMATMIARLYGAYKGADISAFTDVAMDSWYYDYIAQAVQMGTLTGYDKDIMRPNDYITREQAVVVIARTLCLMTASKEDLSQFPDANEIGAWAYDDLCAMVEREFIAGYPNGELGPKDHMTRAEMAQILSRIFSHIYESGTLTGEYDDVVLVRGDVDIHDAVFNGDLIIANGVAEQKLTLEDVTIKGRLVVWGGSKIYVNGKSDVSGVVTPRNDGAVQVIFDEKATALSKKECEVVYPDTMDKDNEVVWTEKTSHSSGSSGGGSSSGGGGGSVVIKKPDIEFTMPEFLYVGDTTTIKSTLTNTDSVEWTLTKDGAEQELTGFTKDGGEISFAEAGTYTLKGVAKRGSYTDACEKTVKVLPVVTLGFSLPEYAHTDEQTNVELRFENGQDGSVVWDLTKDGEVYPLPDGFSNEGGTMALTEPGTYVLTATYTDAAGKVYKESQTITILPVISLNISVAPGETHVDVAATVTANNANLPVQWTLSQNGDELVWDSVTASQLGATGGELLIPIAGQYQLKASVTDAAGRTFVSNEETITIENLLDLNLTVPQYGWTDRAALIELAGHGSYPVSWEVTDDQGPVAHAGTLQDSGGNIQINAPGTYTVKASVTDRLGRVFTQQKTVEILPVAQLTAAANKSSLHLDEALSLSLDALNVPDGQAITWTVIKDGAEYTALDLSNLANIRFPEAGDYSFVAKSTDKAGREYESNEVSTHVIESLEVSLTADKSELHEDETADITLAVDKGTPASVSWSLACNGTDVPVQLGGNGGQLDFAQAGEGIYVLTATVLDELGREYTESVSFQVYPVIALEITAPENIHIDHTADIGLEGNNLDGLEVQWSVMSENGAEVANTLGNNGGTLNFTEPGTHFISASVTDALGREFKAVEKTILVWNTVQLSFKLPEFSHPDETVVVKMTSENLRDNQISWSLAVDGVSIPLESGVDGSLINDGGSIKFTQPGTNVLTATVIDELGRTFSYDQTIEVYPVLALDLNATAATHTDEYINIELDTDTGLPVTWKVTPSNDPDTAAAYTGSLTDFGGEIQIGTAGVYDITASVQDATGRVFTSATRSVKVYPIAGLSFTLPATAWTDSGIPVDLLTQDLIDRNVTWTLTKDGTPAAMQDYVFGSLDDKGGNIRFTDVGDYELTASATDELGREYRYSQSIKIYPVIGLEVNMTETGHTDEAVDVVLNKDNWDGQAIYWTVLRDGVEVAPLFELTEDGGHGFLTEPGLYTFIARTTDELGRETTASDTIQIYPVGQAGFYLPAAFHTDETVDLVTEFKELGDNVLHWTLTRNGEMVQPAEMMSGDLSADGGELQFRRQGDYKLKAVFTDGGGRVYSYEQEFKVYPIPEVSWTLPSYAHTDTEFSVPVKSSSVSGIEGTTIKWFIDDTYGLRQNWDTYVAGNLAAEPGNIRIKHAGIYTIGCEVTDATGRVFTFDGPSIEVLAEQELSVAITETEVYVGHDAEVLTLGNNNTLPIRWSLKRNGQAVDIDKYVTGDLNNYGGFIQFLESGSYELIGTMTDGLGREFSASDTIEVLPVGGLSFSISDMEYVGNEVPVIMDSLVNPSGADVQWSVEKDGSSYAMDLSMLNNSGGKIVFPEVGTYTLIATLDDGSGIPSVAKRTIQIIYKADLAVNAPASVHIGDSFDVSLSGSGALNVKWGVKLGNQPVELDGNTGLLTGTAGTLTLFETGTYTITATAIDDAGNPHTAFATVTVTNTAPSIDSFTADATRNVVNDRYYADLKAACSDPDGDAVHLEWDEEYQEDGYYTIGTHTIRVRAVDEWGATSDWVSRTIEFHNDPPTITSFTAEATRQLQDGKFVGDVSATAVDPDGDTVTLEWDGDYRADGLYDRNKVHTIRVRAVDQYGAVSEWQEKTMEFVNQPPSAPVIHKSPSNGVVRPSQTVTITASSTDPEGDDITYEWEGRDAESTTYDYGKHLIKCRAIDEFGAASKWAAIVFFVADDTGGGMTLEGANSYIEEPGISFDNDGEVIYGYITSYTFNVPAVSGHNGNDYGKIEAYNIKTGKWDQIEYKDVSNGVNFSGTLPSGTYTQMRFYYYTNHDCMYGKSNITYTVEFEF